MACCGIAPVSRIIAELRWMESSSQTMDGLTAGENLMPAKYQAGFCMEAAVGKSPHADLDRIRDRLRVSWTRHPIGVETRTTNRLSSPRCASTIQIVHPLELIVETQPKLHRAC
jgi:hypothetical protein